MPRVDWTDMPKRKLTFALAMAFVLAVAGLIPTLAGPVFDTSDEPELAQDLPNYDPREPITTSEDEDPTPLFARVRFEENGVTVQRRDGYTDDLTFNAPVYVGDEIRTRPDQRGEIQLPDGTLLRVDKRTTVELYALSSESTVIGVARGQAQVDVPIFTKSTVFRIDTPSASIYPLETSSLRIHVDNDGEVTVIVELGQAEVSGETESVVVSAGEATRVLPGRSPRRAAANRWYGDSFSTWVAARDDVYRLRARPGDEYEELPDEVRPYYRELSRHGEWEYVDEYGWVWVPEVDDDWRPYVRGRWSDGPYGAVWVGVEPWGWGVYRYGRWEYSLHFGWHWIPGRTFRRAHVAWYYGPSYVGWCPIGYYGRPSYLSVSFGWGHPYFDHYPWSFSYYNHFYRPWSHHVYHPHHHHGHRYGYGHRYDHGVRARDVRRELARGGGVVSRRSVAIERSRGENRGARRASAYDRALRDRSRAVRRVVRSDRADTSVNRGAGRRGERGDERSRVQRRASDVRDGSNIDGRNGRIGGGRARTGGSARVGTNPGRGGSERATGRRPTIRVRPGDRQPVTDVPRAGRPSVSDRQSEPARTTRPASRGSQSVEGNRPSRSRSGRSQGDESVRRFLGRVGNRRGERGDTSTTTREDRTVERPVRRPARSNQAEQQRSTADRRGQNDRSQAAPRTAPRRTEPQRERVAPRRESRGPSERAAPRSGSRRAPERTAPRRAPRRAPERTAPRRAPERRSPSARSAPDRSSSAPAARSRSQRSSAPSRARSSSARRPSSSSKARSSSRSHSSGSSKARSSSRSRSSGGSKARSSSRSRSSGGSKARSSSGRSRSSGSKSRGSGRVRRK